MPSCSCGFRVTLSNMKVSNKNLFWKKAFLAPIELLFSSHISLSRLFHRLSVCLSRSLPFLYSFSLSFTAVFSPSPPTLPLMIYGPHGHIYTPFGLSWLWSPRHIIQPLSLITSHEEAQQKVLKAVSVNRSLIWQEWRQAFSVSADPPFCSFGLV